MQWRRRFLPSLRGRQPADGLETKAYTAAEAPIVWWGNFTQSMRRAWPLSRAVQEGYERTVWVFKAVDAIASNQAALPLKVVDEEDQPVDDHPLVELLNDGNANPLETGRQFRERLSSQVLLSPMGAFIEVTRSRRGQVARLDLLPPDRTRPVPGVNGELLSHFETITPEGRRVAIPPERVLWVRKPHPTDAYRAMTPMEAVGMSVDLDFLSRLYNVMFLRNDGRPATVLAVEGNLSEQEARRIIARFERGPLAAGQMSVINGKVSVLDLASRPRDMAYGEISRQAKEEVLAAFGVGETVLGNASGRTYDNADAELYQFWTITMPPHLRILETGFRPLLEDGLRVEFDVSGVEVLRRTAAARRAEAREEFAAGLISPDEYREIAEYEPVGTPHTRALYIHQGRTPLPTRPGDEVALGLAPPDETGGGAPGAPGGPEPGPEPDAEPGGEPEAGGRPGVPGVNPGMFDGDDPATRDALTSIQSLLDEQETKTLTLRQPPGDSSPAETVWAGVTAEERQAEQQLAEALTQLAGRLVERTVARANSPKTRKGTRHFVSDPAFEVDTRVGDAPLNVERIVDPAGWEQETEETLTPLVAALAAAALAGVGVPGLPDLPGLPPLPQWARRPATVGWAATLPGLPAALAGVVTGTARWLAGQVRDAAAAIQGTIRDADQAGRNMGEITGAVRAHKPRLQAWAIRAATQATVHTLHAAQTTLATLAVKAGGMATAQWVARMDERTRPTHREAHGQTRPAGQKFQVGAAELRWPGDLQGPPGETYGCRCRLRWLITPPSTEPR
ncbi:phage portal protein [Thermobispora bispora]|uniref:phage portal protein n=1 Tax=Thermobispora bispora TaxID=2006 RepID=UPI0019820698|nr:phage portal protein [Thermobispora bispora]QSI49937.1 phage portal protein [Thermobispora bispora]QSI50039.1 phage portal protein [Thermobispora bispora]